MAATTQGPTPTSARRAEPSGWVIFAAVVLFVSGTFDAIWGLAAVLNDSVVTVGGRGVIVLDFTAWGWVHIVVGAIMIITALGLFGMRGWARWMAIFFAMLSAILQVGTFPAFPLWALVVIALDITVIYQLTANWERSASW
jgi:hypothetical protein